MFGVRSAGSIGLTVAETGRRVMPGREGMCLDLGWSFVATSLPVDFLNASMKGSRAILAGRGDSTGEVTNFADDLQGA